MKKQYKTILRIHGIFLFCLGITMALQTLLGFFKGIGVLKFVEGNALISVGLFEAYLLAGFSGFIFINLSGKNYKKEWHLMPVTVHLILFTTNLLFWKAYSLAEIVAIGYVSTTAHALLILLEIGCYYKLTIHPSVKDALKN